jgi:hypothetical protein
LTREALVQINKLDLKSLSNGMQRLMNPEINHGPRLSGEEYDRRITRLYGDLPPAPNREQEKQVQRQELDIAIDYRLGQDFPHSRREALWAIQQEVEKKRFRLVFKHILKWVFAKSLARDAQGLADYLVDEYAKVLNEAELESYFGRGETLPIDMDQLK